MNTSSEKMFNTTNNRWQRRDVILAIVLIAVAAVILFYNLRDLLAVKQVDLTLLDNYKKCMEDLAETIIPETETPGAKSAGVTVIVFRLVKHCLDVREQTTFVNGLRDLNKYCRNRYGNIFSACNKTEQVGALYHLENEANFGGGLVVKVKQKLFGRSFIQLAKELCATAYCTSMQGATQGLAYDYVPVYYQACVPLEENQHSWATV